MNILGIDPGLTGALAIIGVDGFILEDLPTMANGKGGMVKNQINPYALAAMLEPHVGDIEFAVLEQPNTMPGQSVQSMGSMMQSLGIIEGVLAGLGVSVRMVSPSAWKKSLGLNKDKELSRAMAQRLFPQAPLANKKDHNRAEALLLAVYGRDHLRK